MAAARPDDLPPLRGTAGLRPGLEGADPRGLRRRDHERDQLQPRTRARRGRVRPARPDHPRWEVAAVPVVAVDRGRCPDHASSPEAIVEGPSVTFQRLAESQGAIGASWRPWAGSLRGP